MNYKVGQKVDLTILYHTPLGYRVKINKKDEGLLFHSEVFQEVEDGMALPGYIKSVHEDGKLDISLRPQGFHNVIQSDVSHILQKLRENDGTLQLSDKSSPEDIYNQLHMSKKAFKKAIGNLYRQKKINLLDGQIQLID